MHTPRSLTLLKVNMMSNSRIKVHTKVKECMHECVGVRTAELPWQRNLYLYKPRLQCGGMEGCKPFEPPDCPEGTTHQRLPGILKGVSLPPPKASRSAGLPSLHILRLPFLCPQADGAKQQLAVTMAIAGATLWLERVLRTGS